MHISLKSLQASHIAANLSDDETILGRTQDAVTIFLPVLVPKRGGKSDVLAATNRPSRPDPVLIGALRKAHGMLTTTRGLPFIETAPVSPYEREILRLAFLAHDIQRVILRGRPPHHVNLELLKKMDIPLGLIQAAQGVGLC
ncbi:hypothetical protein [Erythrobacter ani]|uniref:Uncharacterized protein n=1 Tax=Erythrobacter ani TaxID=2827235 RepID=A0ABS6SMH8_9SPHN|nr:hypothetical protein [Erythrobacter ani]MBV7266254.1 hypothetical protein [Erythrobacter ani]